MNYQSLPEGMATFTSVYGIAAGTLLLNLALQYEVETHVEPTEWEVRRYDNGLILLCAQSADAGLQRLYDAVDCGEAFMKAVARTYEVLAEQDDEEVTLENLQTAVEHAAVVSSHVRFSPLPSGPHLPEAL